jgi:hypothetical protein
MAVDGESLIQSQCDKEDALKDVDESSDEYIEQLLRQAEENLAAKDSTGERMMFRIRYTSVSKTNSDDSPHVDPPSKLSLDPKNKANKLLTDQLEDSIVLSATDGTIKQLLPPLSRQQKEKVCSIPTITFYDVTFCMLQSKFPDCRLGVLLH